jgi:hypothetical protein
MDTDNLTSLIYGMVSSFNNNRISTRYYNQPPVGGYEVTEEYEYVIPDDDDISSTVLLELVTQFGSPELDSFMKKVKTDRIKSLSCKRVKQKDLNCDFTCPICIDTFKENEYYRKLKCTHCFHKKCIDSWFKKDHSDCPMCRTKII